MPEELNLDVERGADRQLCRKSIDFKLALSLTAYGQEQPELLRNE
jgi:hypothetical protein